MWKIFTISGKERKLFFEAVWTIIVVRINFIFLSFPRLLAKFQKPSENASRKIDANEIRMIKTAIKRAARLSIWRNKCLVHSLAARRMLNKRGVPSVLYVGVKINDQAPDFGHAWIVAQDIEVVPSSEWHEKIAEY